MAQRGSGGHGCTKKNAWDEQIETGAEVREAIALIRKRASEGETDTLWVEETLKSAALAHVARILGLFYSHELPALLNLHAPSGRHGQRERSVLSTIGPVSYTRAYTATEHKGKTVRSFPLDEALGITEGCTPAMAGMMSWAGACIDSYEAASEAIGRLAGVAVTGRKIQRMVNAVSPQESAWIEAREQEPIKGGILNIQADMTGIPMRPEELVNVKGKDGSPKKCQVKIGAIFRQQANADGEIQRIPNSTTRVVSFDDVTSFSKRLKNEALLRGYLRADTVVFTSDGAEWIWLMVADRFKGVVQIVDFYHAAEHLAALCEITETNKERAAKLFRKRRHILRNWGADSTIEFFTNKAKDHPRQADIEAALEYFITHRQRMKYREFRKKGYFIGSGVIEGSCKCLVNQRTDLGGQRWLKTGSVNVLRIRAAIQDNLHDSYWKSIAKIRITAA